MIPTPVVCAIIERQGLFLATRRGLNTSNAGLWEFPGGKINIGETPEQALIREISEELSVIISIGKSLTPVHYEYPHTTISLVPFICQLSDNQTIKPFEHSEIRFVDKSEAWDLQWAPADVPILQEYSLL